MPLIVSDLRELLAPFHDVASKTAVAPTYRTFEITPDRVAGCAPFGMLEVFMQMGATEGPSVYVDAPTLLAVLASLPDDAAFHVSTEAGTFAWQCGNAKGKLALIGIEDIPRMAKTMPKTGFIPPLGFIDGLRLGTMSGASRTLGNVGLAGMVIDAGTEGRIWFMSSDAITISAVMLPLEEGELVPSAWPDLLTLAPEAAMLLADCIAENGMLSITDKGVQYWDDGARLLLKQVAPLKANLFPVVKRFTKLEHKIAIPPDRIQAFVKRAAALSGKSRDNLVTLSANGGKLSLGFDIASATADEYYMVEGLDDAEDVSITLDAAKLARALQFVTHVSLEHTKTQKAVVFVGDDPPFYYIVSGKIAQ